MDKGSQAREGILVSVIVPVYNVRDYLEQCVESVIGQTHKKLEIILVDDGSTDGSGDLCDELAERDRRIRVKHKENGGLSSARNVGYSASVGEYVLFVDSDDAISDIYVEVLLRTAVESGADMVAVPCGIDFSGAELPELQSRADRVLSSGKVHLLSKIGYIEGLLYQRYNTGAQYRLSRRDALPDYPFTEGILYEDLESVYRWIHDMQSGVIALVDCPMLYAYRQRRDGIIRQDYRSLKADSAIKVSRRLYENISSWYPELSRAAASRCFSVNRMVFAQVPHTFEADKHRIWRELRQYRFTIILDSRARKRERLAATISCLGYGSFSLFCRLARRVGLLR